MYSSLAQNTRQKEIDGDIACKTARTYSYHWILARFASVRQDKHLVQGDLNASPDVESVAGTVIKFCEDFSNCHVLALADEDGMLYLFNTALKGPQSLITRWSIHKNAIFDLEWLPFIPRLVTASGHQKACLIDVSTQQTIDTFKGHLSSLKTIAARRTDPYVFATGGRDGCICVWDQRVVRRGNAIPTSNEIKQAHTSGSRQTRKSTSPSITGLSFQDETTLISCASNDSVIKVWDLRRSFKTHKSEPVAKHKFSYHGKSLKQVGYSGLVMDHAKSFIFANCIDDTVYQFSAISYQDQLVATYSGHKNKTFFVKSALSPDDDFLLTGSSDNNARIYELGGHRPSVYQLQGHTDEVTSVAWSRYETGKLATISDDDTLRVWRLGEILRDDVVEGTCQRVPTKHGSLTKTRNRPPGQLSSAQKQQNLHGQGMRPWPVFKGLDIQPKLSSPKKLLISPRKSSSSSAAGPSSLTLPSAVPLSPSNPVNQAKRRLTDSEYFHPSGKRGRGEVQSPLTNTLSPIRINNSSKMIVNITPTRTKCLADFSSPTANLPNSVLDPQQTPKRLDKENSCTKRQGSDWLSQLGQEKKQKGSSPSCTPGGATPSRVSTRSRSTSKTPTTAGNKKVVQTLMKYFSPSTSSPSTSQKQDDP